ncbi:germin-like protein subfamily 1 member 11 [Alnus glutinosa]|uniref:germin-like protein subfamily 1 member 11 n=1 Tax=Alnus glutinosa TaxID=3517 RepID=UPI002D77D9AB|nr:germin-like protein subfamily 1 member 11 [Alnus glutinosa]
MDEKKTIQILQMTSKEHNNNNNKKKKNVFIPASVEVFTQHKSLAEEQDQRQSDSSTQAVFVNGKFCKDPKLVSASDFFFEGLNIPRNTTNQLGSNVTLLTVDNIFGLNTLGISITRLDFAPYDVNQPHLHPRASEILVVLQGTLYVGFVTSNPDNRLITKTRNAGDVFVFPIGLLHFQFNVRNTHAVAFASLGSQNPGRTDIAENIFGANPPINPDVLTKAFQLDKNVVDSLLKKFAS